MTDLDKLEELAEAATPGPWRAESCGIDDCWCEVVNCDSREEGVSGSGALSKRDARYIAAANPATILTLIAEVRALRTQLHDFTTQCGELNEEVVRLRAFHEFFRDRCEGLFAQFGMAGVDAYNEAAKEMS
ncbi:ead/Ea22-like family protein [Paraburkholderia tropica]|uniref:ead/Ea22-like family protein n=1 Tax=Paraburkholderia tropica TaxID=92647 RepID=UPI0007EDECD0|nr:ead/Ea22-like family protein [Paraburkholderia tropica]OBR52349.1 hypothetical protein A6456_10640 [Paraburkholderia tropica]